MSSTRQAIIEYLQRKPGATTPEISHALKSTHQNIRHHLTVLMEQRVVEIVGREISRKRGRPKILYALASRVHEHNLGGLVGALLEELLQNVSDEQRQELLRRIARNIVVPKEPAESNLTRRLNHAVQLLNEIHYQARWEAHTRAPHLILGHCPYQSILPQHPELCQIDRYLLESLVEVPTEQVEKLARDSRGATFCMFLIKER
jgi:predicted ArsR family transcriptional regulator